MIDFAIRDDDINFWTRPADLEKIYKPLWTQGIPISFSVIPYCIRTYHWGNPEQFYQDPGDIGDIGKSSRLVDFLSEKLQRGQIEIMLHGFSHLYSFKAPESGKSIIATQTNLNDTRQTISGSKLAWLGEYRWKSKGQLIDEAIGGKQHLERTFNTPIKIFVPPSNDLGPGAISAIEAANLNLSGGSNPLKLKYWWFILRHGNPYPYPIKVNHHQELMFYTLGTKTSFDELKLAFNRCIKFSAPFVLATHHWELLKYPKMLLILEKMTDFARKSRANFKILSALMNE